MADRNERSENSKAGKADEKNFGDTRKDKNRRHVTHHGVLTRDPLEALERTGENVRNLRRLERQLRAELKPTGPLGALFFDRFFSSYLRCLLNTQLEMRLRAAERDSYGMHSAPVSSESDLPVLIWEQEQQSHLGVSVELLERLALVQRYDTQSFREMYKALAMLLAMSDNQINLPGRLRQMFGMRTTPEE